MSTPSGATPPLRIGHQERAAASAALDAHLEAGRLDADEYGERYAKATMARTREDLDTLFLDLPAPHPLAPPAVIVPAPRGSGSAPPWRRYVPDSALGRIVAALMLVPVLVVLFPTLLGGAFIWFVVIPLLAGHRHHRRGYRGWTGPVWR